MYEYASEVKYESKYCTVNVHRNSKCLPAAGLEEAAVRLQRGHAEVGYANVGLVVEEQVLRLEVAMAANSANVAHVRIHIA